MQERVIEIMSLYVNGLGNPAKRAKVIAKLKKEKKHIFLLQETHLSNEEHKISFIVHVQPAIRGGLLS